MSSWGLLTIILLIDLSFRILFELGSWSPDLLLLGILFITINYPLGQAYTMAFLYGLIWDAAFLDDMGLHSFLFIMAVMITSRIRQLLWAQYAISRFIMGFALCALVRFGEVIYWLSNTNHEILVSDAQQYVLFGAFITGICFFMVSWEPKPIQVPSKTPVVFGERIIDAWK